MIKTNAESFIFEGVELSAPSLILDQTQCKQYSEQMPLRQLYPLLLVALALRLTLFFAIFSISPELTHSPDTDSYLACANSLLHTGEFSIQGIPETTRTPGYPLFLLPGLIMRHVELITILLQIALSVFAVYLVAQISFKLFSSAKAAQLSAALYALEPLSVIYSCQLLTETLFTSLIVLLLYLSIIYIKEPGRISFVWLALVLAATVYVRPISYYLLFLLPLYFIVSNSRRLLGSGIAFFILSLTLVKAWEIRNYNLTRYPGFSSIKEINLYDYHAAAILAANEGTSFYAMQQKLAYGDLDRYLELHPEQHAWTTGQRFTYMGSKAKKIIADEPLLFIKNYVKGIVFASIEPGAVDLLKQLNLYPQSGGLLGKVIDDGIFATIVMLAKQQPLMFWCNFIFGLLLVLYLCFAGGALLKRQTWAFPGIQLILLFSCYFLALSGGPSALSRFRHPLMPTISILSGYGLSLVLYGRVFFERFFKSTPEENYQSIYKHT